MGSPGTGDERPQPAQLGPTETGPDSYLRFGTNTSSRASSIIPLTTYRVVPLAGDASLVRYPAAGTGIEPHHGSSIRLLR